MFGRRTCGEEEKRRIVYESSQLGVSLSQVTRRYGIYRRLLLKWREELRPKPEQSPAPPVFAPKVTDAASLLGAV